MNGLDFKQDIYNFMAKLPIDRVTTYGDLAALAGRPFAARIVGGIAHFSNDNLPWHRLVNRRGGLAIGFPGGREIQCRLLEQDGISCTDYVVDNFEAIRWRQV